MRERDRSSLVPAYSIKSTRYTVISSLWSDAGNSMFVFEGIPRDEENHRTRLERAVSEHGDDSCARARVTIRRRETTVWSSSCRYPPHISPTCREPTDLLRRMQTDWVEVGFSVRFHARKCARHSSPRIEIPVCRSKNNALVIIITFFFLAREDAIN